MLKQIKFLMLCFMCLTILAGCRGKDTTNNPTEDSTAMPTVGSAEGNAEENPFALPFEEGMSIELPNVGGIEWDEDEETTVPEETIQEFQKPSDHGDNDLPGVPGLEWDEDPTDEPTTPPTDAPTPPPTSSAGENEEDNTTDETNPDATEPEQPNPTDTPDVIPDATEETENEENQLPGSSDIGWD